MQLYGYIFTWGGFDPYGAISNSAAFNDAVERVPTLSFSEDEDKFGLKSRKWSVLLFRSRLHLMGEPDEIRQERFPGTQDIFYPVFLRINNRTKAVVLAGQRYAITDAAVKAFNAFVNPNLTRRVIDVEGITRRLFNPNQEKQFCLTYFLADVPGYGSALTSISLHGDDLAASDFLTEERQNFTARQIGIRSVLSRVESCRIGNHGTLQFRLQATADLERVLNFTYQENFYAN
jgi:hypothetical protein